MCQDSAKILTAIGNLTGTLETHMEQVDRRDRENSAQHDAIFARLGELSEGAAYSRGLANGKGTRKEDAGFGSWAREWWKYVLLVAILAAYAGHEVAPILAKLVGVK